VFFANVDLTQSALRIKQELVEVISESIGETRKINRQVG